MLKDNQCYITGNLGRDPEMKLTKNGKPYCKFTIASSFKSGDKEYTEWVPVQVWGELAKSCGEILWGLSAEGEAGGYPRAILHIFLPG